MHQGADQGWPKASGLALAFQSSKRSRLMSRALWTMRTMNLSISLTRKWML